MSRCLYNPCWIFVTSTLVPQAMGGVPGALGTSQHPSAVSARAPSTSTALPAHSGLRFPSPYRGDPENLYLASNISTEVCFIISFTFFYFYLYFFSKQNQSPSGSPKAFHLSRISDADESRPEEPQIQPDLTASPQISGHQTQQQHA